MQFKIGKTKIKIEADGCVRCGVLWANGWYVHKEIEVRVGKKKGVISIGICANCKNQEEDQTVQS